MAKRTNKVPEKYTWASQAISHKDLVLEAGSEAGSSISEIGEGVEAVAEAAAELWSAAELLLE